MNELYSLIMSWINDYSKILLSSAGAIILMGLLIVSNKIPERKK